MYKTFWYFKIDVKLVWKVLYKQNFNILHLKTNWPNKYCPIKNKRVDSYNLKEQQQYTYHQITHHYWNKWALNWVEDIKLLQMRIIEHKNLQLLHSFPNQTAFKMND